MTGVQTCALPICANTTLGGALYANTLSTNAGGSTILNNGLVSTAGTQTYGDDVVLGANVALGTTNSAVSVAGSITGAGKALSISTGSGAINMAVIGASGSNLGDITFNSTAATTLGGALYANTLSTNAGGSTILNNGTVSTKIGRAHV